MLKPISDQDSNHHDLRQQLEAAVERRRVAGEHFEEVMRLTGGGPVPDERILQASREYTAAQQAVISALLAMNKFLGISSSKPKSGSSGTDSGSRQA